jgi:transposase-like protein
MKPEDLFSKDFFKQFKTGEELTSFFHSLRKRAIEEMLEGELDAHLGYEKHQTIRTLVMAILQKQ